MLVAAAGLAVLAATTKVGGHYPGIVGGLFPMSIGMGVTFVSLTLVATTNVEERDAGLASGIFNTSQQIGGALGLAVLSSIANSQDRPSFLGGIVGKPSFLDQQEALVSGFQTAFIVAAALVAAGTVLTALLLRRRDVARIESGDTVAVPVGPGAKWSPRARRRSGVTLPSMATVESSPALRADAARNRERIVAAAIEVFAERGLEASTAEIAARAGVGEATLFRRFPTKDDLITAIVAMMLEEAAAAGDLLPRGGRPLARGRTLPLRDGRARLRGPRHLRREQGALHGLAGPGAPSAAAILDLTAQLVRAPRRPASSATTSPART